jgi:heterodisulfide reductase subunit A
VVVVYYHDVRAYERAFESFYTRVKGMGVEFVDGEIESIEEEEGGSLRIRMDLGEGEEPDIDEAELEDGSLAFSSDLVVLASAQIPRATSLPLVEQLGVRTDRYGFPMENQVRLFRPTESMVDRVFAIGASVGPKVVQQAVEQGVAGAMKALPVLARGEKEIGKFSSRVDQDLCIRCRTCISVCPHGAISMTPEGAVADPAFCQACGFCAAACPTHAAQLVNFNDEQLLAQADVAFQELPRGEPRILALLCYWCAYGGGDMAGVKRLEAPASFRSIRIRCSSSVSSGLLMELFRRGIDGILVAGCPDGSCHHAWGNYLSDRRIALLKKYFSEMGLSEKRLRFEYIGVPQSRKFVATLERMDRDLRALGPNPIPNLGRA